MACGINWDDGRRRGSQPGALGCSREETGNLWVEIERK